MDDDEEEDEDDIEAIIDAEMAEDEDDEEFEDEEETEEDAIERIRLELTEKFDVDMEGLAAVQVRSYWVRSRGYSHIGLTGRVPVALSV